MSGFQVTSKPGEALQWSFVGCFICGAVIGITVNGRNAVQTGNTELDAAFGAEGYGLTVSRHYAWHAKRGERVDG